MAAIAEQGGLREAQAAGPATEKQEAVWLGPPTREADEGSVFYSACQLPDGLRLELGAPGKGGAGGSCGRRQAAALKLPTNSVHLSHPPLCHPPPLGCVR